MNYLNQKRVYLCGPITAAKDDGVSWRSQITQSLNSFGLIVDDPTKTVVGQAGEVGKDKERFKALMAHGDFAKVKEEFFPIVRKDLRSVDRSDFVIFYYDPSLQMVGSVHELVVAHWQRKPILMYIDPDKVKDINPWILTFIKNGCLFTSWVDMMIYLREIDGGKFNTSHWTL